MEIKTCIIDFIIYVIIFFVLFAGCERYINYAFDLSNEKHDYLIIEQQIDDGHGLPGYDYVFIKYSVKENDFEINELSIPDMFKLHSGDKVKITYRKGVFTPLYSTEYDVNMWIPSFIYGN